MVQPLKVESSNLFIDTQNTKNILVVDDEELVLELLSVELEDFGYDVIQASNGKDALDLLEQKENEIDVVLMDRNMPIMDGLTAIKHINQNPKLKNIPVIMVTGLNTKEDMKQGIEAGVFYYLTKPFDNDVLFSVLSAAMRKAEQRKNLLNELDQHFTGFDLIDTCAFKIKTLSQAENLAAFMANCFPNPTRVLVGLGELLVNAIEHGNLGMGPERKAELVAAGTWRLEVEKQQKLPQFVDKSVTATLAKKPDGIYVIIEDCGEGFDWKKHIDVDLSRAGQSHGRGLAQANATSFDKLTFNEKGNKVIGFVAKDSQLEW